MKHLVAAMLVVSITPLTVPAQDAAAQNERPVITVEGIPFLSWEEYTQSHVFEIQGLRCKMPERTERLATALRSPSHCAYTSTNPLPRYDPGATYHIPVVVHVIKHSDGRGNVSAAQVQNQIDILNEDFRALAGSNGGNGTDGGIQFYLARVDPNGNPTNGITVSTNNSWYNDGGGYWNALAWDTNRYLNIYTNSASGALGYVPDLPQGGIVGSNSDRVVVLWSSFGLNSPIGPPFNKGRTTTHEVGHYFGLEHTFTGGCAGASNCNANGDLICDTNPEAFPASGCPSSSTCGSSDPTDNYMDYSDDLCMQRFTPQQINRMRCTIENWRPNLPAVIASSVVRNGAGSNPLGYSESSAPIIGQTWQTSIDIATPGAIASLLAISSNGATSGVQLAIGELLVVPPYLPVKVSTGSHSIALANDVSLLGRTFWTQGATFSPGDLRLNNAIDITIGEQ